MDECGSTYEVGGGVTLHCVQHLGTPERWKHSARDQWGVRWYWTTEEADRPRRSHG